MAEGQQHQTASILLVDDKQANRAAMAALLESMGHPVLTATSGTAALECLADHQVALILMDVQMPGLAAFEAVARIRERKDWSHIPVVFLTAIHDDTASEARGYALGAVDYVAKPFNADVLIAKLRALVQWHEAGEHLRQEAEERAAERATRAERERILSIVSHDLRSPLSVIRTGADYLQTRAGLGDDQVKIVRRIQRNAERMARLISDLLDFTRLQHGPLQIRPTSSNLAEIVTDSIEDLQQGSQRPIELAVHTSRLASLDGDRLTQALFNLVLNAMQHSEADARVAVSLREDAEGFELSVWNQGELKAADSGALFLPFRKGGASAGMGLGLYISQQIARAHGGDLTVTSSADRGTTFCIKLPVG